MPQAAGVPLLLFLPLAAGAADEPPLDQVLPPQGLHVHLDALLGQLLLLLLKVFPIK